MKGVGRPDRWKPDAPLFHRPRRALRSSLTQLIFAVVGLGAGLLVPLMPTSPELASDRVVSLLFTIGFGIVGLVSVIYSLLFLVVQWASTTFTPRLGIFRDDPIVWRTLAVAVGVFVFTVTAGLSIGDRRHVSVAVPVLAVLSALGALAMMRQLQVRAFASIQLAPALSAISSRARVVVRKIYRRPSHSGEVPALLLPRQMAQVEWQRSTDVLQQIDIPAMVELAARHDAVIAIRPAIGDTLAPGSVLAEVYGGAVREKELLRLLVIGRERSFEQDPGLAFRLLSDIALRALSAAINDPATAVQALDHLDELLFEICDRDLDVGHITDSGGTVRVVLNLPTWEHYLSTALDDVIPAAARSPMVLLRLRTLIRHIAGKASAARQDGLANRLAWADDLLATGFPLIWAERYAD